MMGRDWAKVWVEQGRFQAYFPRLSFAKDGLKLGGGDCHCRHRARSFGCGLSENRRG